MPQIPKTKRRRATCSSRRASGDFHLRRGREGDADTALGYYQAALTTREELYRRNPDSALAARDLSVSQNNLGDLPTSAVTKRTNDPMRSDSTPCCH